MSNTQTHEDQGHSDHHEEGFISKYLFPLDHKMIAKQYLFTGMFMALIGGFMSYAFRWQLAWPGTSVPGYGVVAHLSTMRLSPTTVPS